MHPAPSPTAYTNQQAGATAADPDDATLLARMGAGDEAALGTFFDRWEHAVRALALRIVNDPMDAEDVVEEVFWQAWRQAERFDGERGNAATWILTIARSRSLDRLRSLKRSREDTTIDQLVDSGAESLGSTEFDPLQEIERGERSRRVAAAMQALPVEQREALQLAYYEGLSHTEIAERTGHPLGTVKTRVRLALQKLRERLGDLDEGTA